MLFRSFVATIKLYLWPNVCPAIVTFMVILAIANLGNYFTRTFRYVITFILVAFELFIIVAFFNMFGIYSLFVAFTILVTFLLEKFKDL